LFKMTRLGLEPRTSGLKVRPDTPLYSQIRV